MSEVRLESAGPLGYFLPNSPKNDGKRPLAVLRSTRIVGE